MLGASDILAATDDIPHYLYYLTADELRESLHRLAKEYPDVLKSGVVDTSRRGYPMEYMEIGGNDKTALVYAFAHPDEPVGSLVIIYLARKLAADRELRRVLNCRWVFMPCIDPDGTRLNEGWFKNPFDTVCRFKNHYSPPGSESADFAFPGPRVRRDDSFDMSSVPPSTRALIRIIDRYRPQAIFSLHNIPFAGVHWYVNREFSALFDELYEASDRVSIPINMGDPFYTDDEVFRPGIYRIKGDADGNAETIHISAYYRRKGDGLFLVPEVPIYYCEEVANLSDSGRTKRDVRNCAGRLSLSNIKFLRGYWDKLKDNLNAESVFFPGLRYWLEDAPSEMEKELETLERNPKYDAPASVSEAFSFETIVNHNQCYILGNFLRLLSDSRGVWHTLPEEKGAIAREIERRILDIDSQVRRKNKLIFPGIRDLTRLQTASVLLAVQYG